MALTEIISPLSMKFFSVWSIKVINPQIIAFDKTRGSKLDCNNKISGWQGCNICFISQDGWVINSRIYIRFLFFFCGGRTVSHSVKKCTKTKQSTLHVILQTVLVITFCASVLQLAQNIYINPRLKLVKLSIIQFLTRLKITWIFSPQL